LRICIESKIIDSVECQVPPYTLYEFVDVWIVVCFSISRLGMGPAPIPKLGGMHNPEELETISWGISLHFVACLVQKPLPSHFVLAGEAFLGPAIAPALATTFNRSSASQKAYIDPHELKYCFICWAGLSGLLAVMLSMGVSREVRTV
jgi:hypothetical protein